MKDFAKIKFEALEDALDEGLILDNVFSNEKIRLLPVGLWITKNDSLVREIVTTRNANSFAFFSQEQTNVEQTMNYLLKGAIADPKRVLFVIQSLNREYLGQVGFKALQPPDVELDAVIKGKQDSFSMYHVISHLLEWLDKSYEVKKVKLEVRADNLRAIKLYEKLGFSTNEQALPSHQGHGKEMAIDLS